MSYTESVLSRATTRLEERRRVRKQQQDARRREIYARLPRVAELDRQLRQTVPQVIVAAFRRGADPQEAIQKVRKENLALQAERAALLTGRGYASDALNDTPFCPVCEDSGWYGTTMCTCLKRLCTEEQTKELSSLLDFGSQSFDHFRLNCYGEEFWPTYGCSPRQNMQKVSKICRDYAQNFGHYFLKNLFLFGSTGLGKTFLSACIAREVSARGFSVVYDTAGNIFARFEEQKFSRDMSDIQQAKGSTRKYLRCDLLILDDLGSEMTTPFVQSALYHLVNTRLAEGRCTIVSSNLNMGDVHLRYTPQIASRLEGEYQSLPFFGTDIRLLRKGG